VASAARAELKRWVLQNLSQSEQQKELSARIAAYVAESVRNDRESEARVHRERIREDLRRTLDGAAWNPFRGF